MCLLGPVELVVHGQAVPFGGARQRAILVYLALQGGTAVSAATLVDNVWGDDAPASVNKSLTTQLARLRKIIEPFGWTLAHTGTGYRLILADDALDVAVFEDLVAAARRELDRDDPAAAARVLGRGARVVARRAARGSPRRAVCVRRGGAAARAPVHPRRTCSRTPSTRTGDLDQLVTLMQQLVDETPFWEERGRCSFVLGAPDAAGTRTTRSNGRDDCSRTNRASNPARNCVVRRTPSWPTTDDRVRRVAVP